MYDHFMQSHELMTYHGGELQHPMPPMLMCFFRLEASVGRKARNLAASDLVKDGLIRVANISSAFGIWDLTPTGNM